MNDQRASADSKIPSRRLTTGTAIFVVGQLAPLAIPLVTRMPLSTSVKTALSGLLLLGIPEISILLAVAILGRAGFDELKSRLLGLFKQAFVPAEVSRRRYYFGLTLFLIPVFVGLVPHLAAIGEPRAHLSP